MGLIEFIVLAAVIGLIAYAVTAAFPMPAPIALIIKAAAVLVVLVLLIRALGLDVAIPRVR